MEVRELYTSLIHERNVLIYKPEHAYEMQFALFVQEITNTFVPFALSLPNFAQSDAYRTFCEAAVQVGFFLAGLPSLPQNELEA